jgi:drug/metabolite transporter (DMT)-like permease
MARLFLGERITPRTVAIVAAAFAGLFVMVVGDLHAGNIVGDLAAVSSAIGFAAYTAIVKSAPDRDWSPVLPGYGVLMIAICAAVTLGNSKPLVPPAPDIALAVVHGGLFIVAGTLLYNGASRNVPAAAMTVFAQTEMVLVPLWAFLVLAERPRPATIVGGTIILAAVLTKAVGDARVDRAAAATTTSTTDEPPPPPEGPALAPAA